MTDVSGSELDQEGDGEYHEAVDPELLVWYIALEEGGYVTPGDPRPVSLQVDQAAERAPEEGTERALAAEWMGGATGTIGSSPFVSCSGWGARTPSVPNSSNITPQGNTGHWEGPHMGWPWDHARCPAMLRGIQAYHMDGHGWNDLAYNSVECPHGTIYEGRWLGHRSAANGTNVSNQTRYAHCVMFGAGDAFTPEAKRALRDVFMFFRQNGSGPAMDKHKDHFTTACPGPEESAFIDSGLTIDQETLPMGYPFRTSTVDHADWVTFHDEATGLNPSWMMTTDGAVFGNADANKVPANIMGVNGKDYFKGKTAAQLHIRQESGVYVDTIWSTDKNGYRPDGKSPFRVYD